MLALLAYATPTTGLITDALTPPPALDMEEKRASSALPLDIEEKKTASSAFPPIYAVGWAKAGTTVMAAALAAGMGVEASLEAANTCCCGNRECDLLTVPSCTPGGMQEASIMAPLLAVPPATMSSAPRSSLHASPRPMICCGKCRV